MATIDQARTVVGGIDTHLELHVAAAVDPVGGLLGAKSFAASPAGYKELLGWLSGFGQLAKVGMEGTGAYGAGVARYLQRAGVEVIEVDRPNRQARRKRGKSDPADAEEAARAVLSGQAVGRPKTKEGNVEAIRALVVAKRSARAARVQALVQMRQLTYTGPERVRSRFKALGVADLVAQAAALRPRPSSEPVRYATEVALSSLSRRVLAFDEELRRLDELLASLVAMTAPKLLACFGVGVDTAAILLVAAGDNPERLRSEAAFAHLCGVSPIEASSGKVIRRRLDRGGNRQANQALWRIVMVRLATDPRTRAYLERRTKEGRSKREVIRILKRYVAREVFKLLPRA